MAPSKDLSNGTWVFRSKPLFNDDQKIIADSVGRVSRPDGSLTIVRWLGASIPTRIPVHPGTLKYLNGQADSFDDVLVKLEKIQKEFLFIVRGDMLHLHSPAIHNLLNAIHEKLKSLCPKAAGNIKLAIKDFESFCDTKEAKFADWFCRDLRDAIKAFPWV